MRTLPFTGLILLGLIFITACSSQTEQTSDGISLHKGEKWPVNAEMKPHIQQGKEILAEYQSANDTDYKTLAEKLKKQNADLISSCTMDGESHNQLHNWLLPHMKLITKLKEAPNEQEAEQVIMELEKSFETYNKYFE